MTQIDHLVVLMLENRSFDHMLGHLTYQGHPEIDGLPTEQAFQNSHAGQTFRTHAISAASQSNPYRTSPDPRHDWESVAAQLAHDNGGFVDTYATAFASGSNPTANDLGQVMGHYTGETLYAYQHLAREYLVCDRWHASLPGETQINRMYAMTGTSGGLQHDQFPPRLYEFHSIFDELSAHNVAWKAYSHDVSSLRFLRTYAADVTHIQKIAHFYQAARTGQLASVSWIDPDFNSLGGSGGSNDDHPDSDVRLGQELVARIYNALIESPGWARTLFVVLYDEHGGFYDHVAPSSSGTPADDHLRQYGVRVPALLVSPLVPRGAVYHGVLDHTSLIKTILQRFCAAADGSVPNSLGQRVAAARGVWPLLSEPAPRTDAAGIPVPAPVRAAAVARVAAAAPLRAGQRRVAQTQLQQDLKALAAVALAQGVDPDKL
jgi:phospholipase C